MNRQRIGSLWCHGSCIQGACERKWRMLAVREINAIEHLDELVDFSREVYGIKSYQADPRYYKWLYQSNPLAGNADCCAAFEGNKLVGVIHKMRLPLGGTESGQTVACIHNHIVRKDARAGVGFLLLKKAQKAEFSVFAPGVSGRTKLLYESLKFAEIETALQVKPLSLLKLSSQLVNASLGTHKNKVMKVAAAPQMGLEGKLMTTLTPTAAQMDRIAVFLNSRSGPEAMQKVAVVWTGGLVQWRFFSDIGPKHVLVYDETMSKFSVISLGSRNGVSIARLILIYTDDVSSFAKQLAKVARLFGASLFMAYSQDKDMFAALAQAKWKERKIQISAFFYVNPPKALATSTAITDFGFEAVRTEFA
jgi:hypothetical protein